MSQRLHSPNDAFHCQYTCVHNLLFTPKECSGRGICYSAGPITNITQVCIHTHNGL